MKMKRAQWTWIDTMEVCFQLELRACFVREHQGRGGVRRLFYRLQAELVC